MNISSWYQGLQINYTSQEQADQQTGFASFFTGAADDSSADPSESDPDQAILKMRQLIEYNGYSDLVACAASGCPPAPLIPAWDSPVANRMPRASEGVQFYPGLDPSKQLPVFVEQANRAFQLETLDQNQELYGITMYRYTIVPAELENATVNPANSAYDSYGPRGLINMSRTEHSMPLFMSKPHFLDCDPAVWQPIFDLANSDLSPHRELHDIYIDVEPNLGTTFNARKRLQVNMRLQPLNMSALIQPHHPEWFVNLTTHQPLYMPIAWFEEAGTITPSLADKFKDQVYYAQRMERVTRAGGWCAAALCVGMIWIVFPRKPKKTTMDDDDTATAGGVDPLSAGGARKETHSDHKHSGNTTGVGDAPRRMAVHNQPPPDTITPGGGGVGVVNGEAMTNPTAAL